MKNPETGRGAAAWSNINHSVTDKEEPHCTFNIILMSASSVSEEELGHWKMSITTECNY